MVERGTDKDWKVGSGNSDGMTQFDSDFEAWLADLLVADYLSELSEKGKTDD